MPKVMVCRYCGRDATHICDECGTSGLAPGKCYCAAHVGWHDRIVRENGGTIFARPITDQDRAA